MNEPMPRYHWSLILTHWLAAILVGAALAVAWYASRLSPRSADWVGVFELHASLGLTSVIFLVLLLILRWVHKAPPYNPMISRPQAVFARALNSLIYIGALLTVFSGCMHAVYARQPLRFWTIEVPMWSLDDPTLSQLYGDLHGYAFYGLTALVVMHILTVLVYARIDPGFMGRILPELRRQKALVPYNAPSRKTKRLARRFIVYGWAGFLVQFGIAALAVLMLLFAGSGQITSTLAAGIGLSIFWANCGILVLVFSILLSFYFTRIGKKLNSAAVTATPYRLATPIHLVQLGILAGMVGIILSLVGSGLGIAVFVSKVVSQPPGIAITDPQRIIRALDVFVLMANFTVIAGHVSGTAVSLWLLRLTHRHQVNGPKTTSPPPPSHPLQNNQGIIENAMAK